MHLYPPNLKYNPSTKNIPTAIDTPTKNTSANFARPEINCPSNKSLNALVKASPGTKSIIAPAIKWSNVFMNPSFKIKIEQEAIITAPIAFTKVIKGRFT